MMTDEGIILHLLYAIIILICIVVAGDLTRSATVYGVVKTDGKSNKIKDMGKIEFSTRIIPSSLPA